MPRRSISFPPQVWARIKTIGKENPHYTENAIVIEYLQRGLNATAAGQPAAKARKEARA